MLKRFLVSVGDVVAMKGNDIVFTAKTLADSSITIDTSNTEIRGGVSNSLQAVYYHSGTLNISLTDTQFRLPYIALNTGSAITLGGDIWTNETVTLVGNTGTLVGTPKSIAGQPISCWTEYNDNYYTFTVTGNTFSTQGTAIPENSTLCVMYMNSKSSAQSITIPANIIPDRIRLYITANLYGDVSGDGFVGKVQIEVPVAQLSGAQEISMTSDGYSNTPLTAMALAYSDSSAIGCTNGQYYAKITEYLNESSWYDGVTALAISGGDFSMKSSGSTTLRVYAVKGGSSFLVDNSELTFKSGTASTATIGEHTGIVSPVAEGSTLLTVSITEKPTIEASCTLTVQD
jgi:hypothetical protein